MHHFAKYTLPAASLVIYKTLIAQAVRKIEAYVTSNRTLHTQTLIATVQALNAFRRIVTNVGRCVLADNMEAVDKSPGCDVTRKQFSPLVKSIRYETRQRSVANLNINA
jgi:hypothetical protein